MTIDKHTGRVAPACTAGETADVVRITTDDGAELGVARFTAGHCVLVAQDRRSTVLCALSVDQALVVAQALRGGA